MKWNYLKTSPNNKEKYQEIEDNIVEDNQKTWQLNNNNYVLRYCF